MNSRLENFPLTEILERLDSIENLLAELVKRQGLRRDPRYLSLSDAAEQLGLSGANPVEAVRKRIRRARAKGAKIRTRRGAVRREDWNVYLSSTERSK